jgi:hypothetical protein
MEVRTSERKHEKSIDTGAKKIKANAEKRLMLEQIEKGMLFKRQN